MANVVRITFDDDAGGTKPLSFNGVPIRGFYTSFLTGYIDVDYTSLSVSGEPIITVASSYGSTSAQGLQPGIVLYNVTTDTFSYYSPDSQDEFSTTPLFTYQGIAPTVINNLDFGPSYYVTPTAPVTSTINPPPPVCFGFGTRIRTARGDVAIEALVVGDIVVTAAGEHRPVCWLGSRLTHCRRHAEPHNVLPVRIRAEAFGPACPVRDLVVSPSHALAFDICGEVLVPAIALVDGVTIVQEEVARVTYWHVELDSHDLLIAEGVPAESYLDMGNRGFFAGEEAVLDLAALPDADAPDRTGFCRPFHGAGPVVEAIRERLTTRYQQAAERSAA